MAKISIEYDTVEKTLVARKDGMLLENVEFVELWKEYDGDNIHIRVVQNEKDEANDMVEQKVIMASMAEYLGDKLGG